MVAVLTFEIFFSFCSQNYVGCHYQEITTANCGLATTNQPIRAGIHKMLVRIANREDPDQTASSEAVGSGPALFCLGFFGRQLILQILEHLL